MAKKQHKEATKHETHEHTENHEKTAEHSEHHKKSTSEPSYWKYTTFVFALISVALLGYMLSGQGMTANTVVDGDIDKVATDTVDYINDNLLSAGSVATLENSSLESGVYKVVLNIGGQAYESYVSTDGKLLFPSAVDLTETVPSNEEQPETQPTEVPKTDKPVVNVFVMSYCPYGLQMEKAMIPVMELLGDKVDFNVDYVNYIMHGTDEINQNNYQHCIESDQSGKFVAYLKCFVQSDDHEGCMVEAGVDSTQLDACVARIDAQYNISGLAADQSTWSGGRYPPYKVDETLVKTYGVGGSPTFVINGKTVSVSRSPEAVKQAICAAFNTPPAECDTALSTSQEAAGIGALGSGSDSGSTASCG